MQFHRFDLTDLRLIAELFQYSPLTRTIKNKLGASSQRSWTSDLNQDLTLIGDMISDPITVAIRRNFPSISEILNWDEGCLTLRNTFALSRSWHLFRVQPILEGTNLIERQLTELIANFLNDKRAIHKVERIRALITAMGASELAKDITNPIVTAEKGIADQKRLDLFIRWSNSSGEECAALLEAKINHEVSDSQLADYAKHIRQLISKNDRRVLILVGVHRTENIDRVLKHSRNREWKWKTWHDLLITHERCLSDEFDDEAYARFRKTLWNRTG